MLISRCPAAVGRAASQVWIAQEKLKADQAIEKSRLEDMRREQTDHDNKGYALMTRKESEMAHKRHDVNFMYELPPGVAEGRTPRA